MTGRAESSPQAVLSSQDHLRPLLRPNHSRRGQLCSALASVVLHIALCAAIFIPLGSMGDENRPGIDEANSPMEVSIVPASTLTTTAEARPTGASASLRVHLRQATDGYVLSEQPSQSHSLTELLQHLTPTSARTSDAAQGESRARSDSVALSKISQEATQGDAGSGEQGLAGSLEPCWRELGGALLKPVTIEVTLDERGRLARPPAIIRSAGAKLDELRLRSEAAAISALAACAGKADPRFAGATYRVELGRPALR